MTSLGRFSGLCALLFASGAALAAPGCGSGSKTSQGGPGGDITSQGGGTLGSGGNGPGGGGTTLPHGGGGILGSGGADASSDRSGMSEGGSQSDAPLGGSAGQPGTGGAGGTIITSRTGGAGGNTTVVQTGGTGGTTAPWTVPPGCGDGVVVFPERCDDGNTMPFDGCSSECQVEPDCSGSGPCTSKCGDGLVLGEDCDDGNTADGDGCSSSCKVEAGYTCTQASLGDKILVPVVYRDFKFQHPTDFEAGVTGRTTATTGAVKVDLDPDGKPVFSGQTDSAIHIESSTTFASWYRNTDGVNHATVSTLPLWSNGSGAYVNRYGAHGEQFSITTIASWCGVAGNEATDSNGAPIPCTYQPTDGGSTTTDCDKAVAAGGKLLACTKNSSGTYTGTIEVGKVDGNPLFFPVDSDPFSSSELKYAQIPSEPKNLYDASGLWPHDTDASGRDILHNFSFTSEIRTWFKYEADTAYTLDIVGDDDVWVFINRKLAVDLGGIHEPVEGSVTLDSSKATNLGLRPGNVYEVAVFQAERQTTSSTFKITLMGFNLAPSVCRPQ